MAAARQTGRAGKRALVIGLGLGLVTSALSTAVPSPARAATPVDIQIIGTNDFHGRISQSNGEAGAAVLSGAVKQLRAANPNTVFTAAGDLIGASTFESFSQQDVPTIDALNEAGLEVSAVGNHEFDAGYEDLAVRVQGLADWTYLATNVTEPAGRDDLAESWTKTMAGVQVGFVGAVTEDLPFLVSPAGIQGVTATDVVQAVNAEATTLKAGGADVVVMLVHEGATTTALTSATDNSAFGQIVNGASKDIDAIVSGHTHLAYNHSIPVPAWVTEGRAVTERPVVSAGQYGTNLNKLVFTVDADTGAVTAKTQEVLALRSCGATCSAATPTWTNNYPVDPAVTPIVTAAVNQSEVIGAEVLGKIGGPFSRAKLANGTTENRGGESNLGNLVAEVQRWATESETTGSAQIAFMNPGGLRQDMSGTPGGYPADLTKKQAAVVQPFANTLVNMKLSGADIKVALEQQWQRDAAGNVPSRPFLRLGASKGFTYTYDNNRPEGHRITGMWLDGQRVTPAGTYSVTVNSFLASGGDNFRAFNSGTEKRDTGKVDLVAMQEYMAALTASTPLPVDSTQRAVGVSFPRTAPDTYAPGDTVSFNLSSFSFAASAVKDTEAVVKLNGTTVDTVSLNNTVGPDLNDETGRAAVIVPIPESAALGAAEITVTGSTTGTTVSVPITVRGATTLTATASAVTWGKAQPIKVGVVPPNASGAVRVRYGDTLLASGTVTNSAGTVTVPAKALKPGSYPVTVSFLGDSTAAPATATVRLVVTKAAPALTVRTSPAKVRLGRTKATVRVRVTAAGGPATGRVVITGGGRTWVKSVKAGVATVKLPTFRSVGRKKIQVRYLGSDTVRAAAKTVHLRVTKK